jgi:hypothetical protein
LVSAVVVAAAEGSTGVNIGTGLVSAGGGVAGMVAAGVGGGLCDSGATAGAGVVSEAAGATLVSAVVVAAAAGSTGVITGAGLVSAGGGVVDAGVIVAAEELCGLIATGAAGVGVGSDIVVLAAEVAVVAAEVVAAAAEVVALFAGVVVLAFEVVVLAAEIVALVVEVVALVVEVFVLAGTVLVGDLLDFAFTSPEGVTTTGGAWVDCLSNSPIFWSKAARRAACIGVSSARTDMKLAQKTAAQTMGNNLEICMTLFYAYFPPDATAFPVAETNFFHAPGRG